LALIPPLFIIIGFIIIWTGITRRDSVARREARRTPSLEEDRSPRPAELSPDGTRSGAVFGVLFFALFWNGITGIFAFHAVADWIAGNGSLFLVIMLM